MSCIPSSPGLHTYTATLRLDGVDFTPVYNTLNGGARSLAAPTFFIAYGGWIVIRCPECSAEIDVDEDEVEEGEILSCPECESELEVSQIHPVHLNIISEDLDDDEDDEDKEEEIAENGDLPEDEEEDDEEEDEE